MNIKAIGFDLGGVITIQKKIMEEISAIINIPLEEIKRVYFENNKLANIGNMPYEEMWVVVLQKLSKQEHAKEVVQLLKDNSQADINRPVLSLVEELRDNGFRVGLLSNNSKENGDRMRAEGIAKHFDVFLISAEIRFQKPDTEAYQVLFDSLQVKPDELIYIDDSEASLRLAGEIGYHPLLFKSCEQLRTDLVKLGILKS